MGRLKKYKTEEEKKKAQKKWANQYYHRNKEKINKICNSCTPDGTRTHNLSIRSRTRYPITPRGYKNIKK